MSANDKQIGGQHYKTNYEHWDFVEDVNLPYMEAQVVKYVTRYLNKKGAEDLEKAQHFLEKLCEQRSDKNFSLREYSVLNNLDVTQERIIWDVICGNFTIAHNGIRDLLADLEASEPDRGYVDQG